MNRYYGSGSQRKRVHIPESEPQRECGVPSQQERNLSQKASVQPIRQKQPPNPFSALGSGFGGILSKIGIAEFEAEDWILLLVLDLMYRESGDEELLFMLGAMLFGS